MTKYQIPYLLEGLKSREAFTRNDTIKKIIKDKIDDEQIINILKKIIETDPSMSVRQFAGVALEGFGIEHPRVDEAVINNTNIAPIIDTQNTPVIAKILLVIIAIIIVVISIILVRWFFLASYTWIQISIPGSIDRFLGVSIEDDICYTPDEIDFYVLLRDKSIYQCPVGGSCMQSPIPESLHLEGSGGLGTFCSFEFNTFQDGTPNPLPEGHGSIKDSLHVSGGEFKVIDIYYVIFEDGTLWWVE